MVFLAQCEQPLQTIMAPTTGMDSLIAFYQSSQAANQTPFVNSPDDLCDNIMNNLTRDIKSCEYFNSDFNPRDNTSNDALILLHINVRSLHKNLDSLTKYLNSLCFQPTSYA